MVAQNPQALTAEQQQRVSDNMGLVHKLAIKYAPIPGDGRDDAIQNGTLGLIHAALHFDASRRYRFSTYAYRCIWGQICSPHYRETLKHPTKPEDLHPSIGKDIRRQDATDEDLSGVDGSHDLSLLLKILGFRELRVIRMRFGIGGHQAMTLEQIGDSLGITKERVRQIQNKALLKMRQYQEVEVN